MIGSVLFKCISVILANRVSVLNTPKQKFIFKNTGLSS